MEKIIFPKEGLYDVNNSRAIEIPMALLFLNKYPDCIEIGAVTPYHYQVSHKIYDLTDEYPLAQKIDADNLDFNNQNVLSISTIEHIGTGDYGNEIEIEKSFRVLEKIYKYSKNCLITIPIGHNKYLEECIQQSSIPYYFWIKKDLRIWEKSVDKIHFNAQENFPFFQGNAILVIEKEFTVEKLYKILNIEDLSIGDSGEIIDGDYKGVIVTKIFGDIIIPVKNHNHLQNFENLSCQVKVYE